MLIIMNIHKEILYFSKKQVQSIGITIKESIDVLEQVYKAKSIGKVEMGHSDLYRGFDQEDDLMRAYLGAVKNRGEYGIKWLATAPDNTAIGLPVITGLIIINDPKTLLPISVMDCTHITGIRTAAVSGIGMRALARKDTTTMTVLGCGLQGRTHLDAAVATLPYLKTVYAYGPRIKTAERYKAEMERRYPYLDIIVTDDAKKAIRESMLVTSSTPFADPESLAFIDSDYISPGTTMISISGLNHLLFEGFKSFNKCYVDDYETIEDSRIKDRPEFKDSRSMVSGELGDILTGKITGRRSNDDKIILATGGLAINDIPIAHLHYKVARENGIGTILPL